jgi:hypothetical protein
MIMESKEKKSANYYMRLLHRYAGFFIFGFVILYGLSGIVLIYRDTDFLKQEKKVSLKLAPGINQSELGSALRMREFKVEKTEGDIIYFQGGSYDKATGTAEQTIKELRFPFNKLTALHKTPSKNSLHWFTLIFGIGMLFLAISSLWMFKPGSVIFKKGVIVVVAGIFAAIILLYFIK